jgi:copper transport protein
VLLGLLPAPPAAAEESRTVTAADLLVTISATPNAPGVNAFTVLAASSRRPPPAPLDGVTLELRAAGGPVEVSLAEVEPGRYAGTAQIAAAGPLRLSAVLRRGGQRLVVAVSWRVAAAPPGPAANQTGRSARAPIGPSQPAPYRAVLAAWLLSAALLIGARRVPAGVRRVRVLLR